MREFMNLEDGLGRLEHARGQQQRGVARRVSDPFAVDWMELLCREVLRERTGALVAEACAWAVGLSDQPHHERRHGRVVPSGLTVGARAETDRLLAAEEDGRIDLGDARRAASATR